MTYQKLSNTLTAELRKFKPKRVKISLKHLRYLFAQYEIEEVSIKNYCCYGEDKNCWIDIEGIDYGWLFVDHTKEEMPFILLKYLKDHIHGYMDSLYKRRAFIYKEDNHLIYLIPMRDIAKYDVYVSFKLV